MACFWWSCWHTVDWEHEFCYGRQQDPYPDQWWTYFHARTSLLVVWSRGSSSGLPCYCVPVWYGVQWLYWLGLETICRELDAEETIEGVWLSKAKLHYNASYYNVIFSSPAPKCRELLLSPRRCLHWMGIGVTISSFTTKFYMWWTRHHQVSYPICTQVLWYNTILDQCHHVGGPHGD